MIKEWFDKISAIINHQAGMKIRAWEDKTLLADPSNAIWFFGCSHVYGIGLEHNETAPYQLSRLLDYTVINYGRPGAGPITIKDKVEELLKRHRPRAIIVAWPSFDRWQSKSVLWIPNCLTDRKMHSDNFGSKKLWPKEWQQYKDLVMSGEVRVLNLEAVEHVRKLVNGIPYIEFSYTDNDYNITAPVFPFKDVARDDCHPGVETQKRIAEWLNDELRLLLE